MKNSGDNTTASDQGELTDGQKTLPKKPAYEWIALGRGSYNTVWRSNFSAPMNLVSGESYQGPWVLKYPIPSSKPILDAMNNKHRAIRVWNEINHTLPKAGLHKLGWVAPFIKDVRQASDDEIAQKLLEIYCDTRRIVVDAATEGNFVTDIGTGEVVLIDVDLAIKRSQSRASQDFHHILYDQFASYWDDPSLVKLRPQAIEMIRNLLFLEENLDFKLIDKLCYEKHLTCKNIQTLTWFRTTHTPLTFDVFIQIATLNEAGIPISVHMLKGLTYKPTGKFHSANDTVSHLFFSPVKDEQELDDHLTRTLSITGVEG